MRLHYEFYFGFNQDVSDLLPFFYIEAKPEMRNWNMIAIYRIEVIMRLEIWVCKMADELMAIEIVINPLALSTTPTLLTLK